MGVHINMDKTAAEAAFAVAWIKAEEKRRKRSERKIEQVVEPVLSFIEGSANRRTKPRGKLRLIR